MALEDLTGVKYLDSLVSANPVGSVDLVNTLDDHVRGVKNVLKLSFPNVNAPVTPTPANFNNITGLTVALAALTASAAELNILDGVTANATELNLLTGKILLSGDNVIDNLPAGTITTFQQTNAPTGYTKLVVHNDKSLRVVSGAAGSGGATAFTTVFGAAKSSGLFTLLETHIPAHTHTTNLSPANGAFGGGGHNTSPGSGATSTSNSTGGGVGHQHTLSLDLQYVDLILASKN